MHSPATDSRTAEAATMLIDAFGHEAALIAAARADTSRDKGNALGFCHWRQVERFILILQTEHTPARVH